MKADYKESLAWLEWWRPGGPWTLVAIAEGKGITAETFEASQVEDLLKWLEFHGGSSNVYFCVNGLLRSVSKKPLREDVASLDWLHVDVDPRAGEDLHEEQQRILKMLQEFSPRPSAIVYSGGGYQAFWRLEESLPIDGKLPIAEDLKRYNLQLESLFSADACHNVDRIMRLPGTMNRPDAKKRKKGRKTVKATVVEREDVAFSISDFTKAPQVQGSEGSLAGTVKIEAGNIRRLQDIDELPESVPPACKETIVQGRHPVDPNKWGGDRSDMVWWVVCELIRQGVDDETIYSIITDQDFAISEHVFAQGSRWHLYALRQIERAKAFAVKEELLEMNDKYAVITNVGGKCRVLTESEELIGKQIRSKISYMSFEDIRNAYRNRLVKVGQQQNGTDILEKMGHWWLDHPKRRQYETVVFSPEREIDGAYNLWKGFAFEAVPDIAACQPYLDHVLDVICSGKQEHYDYLIRWMATAVQHPGQPGHVAVVLRGGQGVGKGSFVNHFGALFGRHYLAVQNSEHLFGRFNAHLIDCALLFADEAFWAGNKKHEGQLKALVTEEMMISERKNFDAYAAANYMKLIMASNGDWVVPADVDDRRFLVLDVSDERKQKSNYFRALAKAMQGGGYQALLHFLLSIDLEGFDVRKVPQTDALRDQKIRSYNDEKSWWFAKISDGCLLPHLDAWPQEPLIDELVDDFSNYRKSWSRRTEKTNSTILGQHLRKFLPANGWKKVQAYGQRTVRLADGSEMNKARPRIYRDFPTLQECRAHWDKKFGGPFNWDENVIDSSPEEDNRPPKTF